MRLLKRGRWGVSDKACCSRCGNEGQWCDVLLVLAGESLCYECARQEIEALRAKIDKLIDAGDKMRWACRRLVAPIPTGERDWREWNTCVERWLQAQGEV